MDVQERFEPKVRMPTLSRSFSSLSVRVLLGRFLVFVFWKHDVQNDRDRSCGDDARAAEDQANELGRTGQHGGVRANAVAQAKRHRDDAQVARRKGLARNQLNAAHHDGGEHHNGCAAENRLGHDGDHGTELRAQAAQNQEYGAAGQGLAVDHFGHCDQADVLAE